jgi:hypothetical protein
MHFDLDVSRVSLGTIDFDDFCPQVGDAGGDRIAANPETCRFELTAREFDTLA